MKTCPKVAGIILLLAAAGVAQTTKMPDLSSSWSTLPTGVGSVSPNIVTSRQMAPVQLSATLPGGMPSSSAALNSMMTTITSGPVHLGSGDLLEIAVFDSPELTSHVRVTSDGEISFPLLGKLQVGGLTPQELQNLIRQQLIVGDFVKDPQVAVFVVEYANQAVYVIGEVGKPGSYPLVGEHRLFELISAAGGFSPRAGKSITITRQTSPDSPQVIRFSRHPDLAVENI